jgi:hypothetical protein
VKEIPRWARRLAWSGVWMRKIGAIVPSVNVASMVVDNIEGD